MTPTHYAIKSFESAANNYYKDLGVLTEEQILESAGGVARTPVDFTYEVAFINKQRAARLRGEEPEASPEGDDWWLAPDELRSKEAITAYFRSSCDEVLEVANTLTEEQQSTPIGTAGYERPPYAHLNFLALHAMYHAAQLNFIQTLNGDLKMHWG